MHIDWLPSIKIKKKNFDIAPIKGWMRVEYIYFSCVFYWTYHFKFAVKYVGTKLFSHSQNIEQHTNENVTLSQTLIVFVRLKSTRTLLFETTIRIEIDINAHRFDTLHTEMAIV